MWYTAKSQHMWWTPFIMYYRYKVLNRFKQPYDTSPFPFWTSIKPCIFIPLSALCWRCFVKTMMDSAHCTGLETFSPKFFGLRLSLQDWWFLIVLSLSADILYSSGQDFGSSWTGAVCRLNPWFYLWYLFITHLAIFLCILATSPQPFPAKLPEHGVLTQKFELYQI